MVLTSKFGGGNGTPATAGEQNFLAASLDFMVNSTATNKARLAQACVEHKPGSADNLNKYFAKVEIVEEPAQRITVAPAAKKPGSLM